jgi:stage V sporulation protein B
MRGVGVAFNVFVSNRAGSEAMGLYSLLGSVYMFSITLASAGINLGTTRVVADALGIQDNALAKKYVRCALLCALLTSALCTVLLYTSAPLIGVRLLGDSRSISSLMILSSSLVPVALCSCLSGYFTAVRRVKVNAFMQIFVQISKIALTVFLLSQIDELSPESACIALVTGNVISEILSLLLSFTLYRFDLKKLSEERVVCRKNTRYLTKSIFTITLPVTVSACIRSALSMLQHSLIPKGLYAANGYDWNGALSTYGALHGMAMPIILFPSALIIAFAGLLIPEISECCIQKNNDRLKRVSHRALTLSLIFSIGVSGIMLFFSNELGMLIYNSPECAKYIRIIAPLIPVMYIDSAIDAILKGSGHQVYSMNVNIADTLTACIFALTLIPAIGIDGYVISIYATEILNTSLSLYKLIKISKIKTNPLRQVFFPVLCIVGATNLAKLILSLLSQKLIGVLGLICHIALTAALYFIFLMLTKTIGQDEKEFFVASLISESRYDEKYRKKCA